MSSPRSAAKKAAARPSLARKVTPGSEANRKAALDEGVRMTVDGQSYEVRMGDITSTLARELRREYGGSFNKLRDELGNDPDADSIATFIWLARRARGDEVAFEDVEITYAQILADDFDVAVAGAEVVDDSPEA